MCKGDKSCNCGCKDQYNLDLGTPLTFGDGGYISKKIVQDLDQRLLKQFPNDPQARAAMREQAMGVIRQMAYGGLTNKQSGSQKVDYNPDAAVSNNLYDQGLSVNEVDTSIMEGTTKEKLKDVGRTVAQVGVGITTGVIDAAGSMAGIDTEPLTGKLSDLKFGEMDKGDLDFQQKANQMGQTVGATGTTMAAGIVTGGNPTVISRGANQAFQELGQIDPNSSTLNTISNVGQVGSQLYGGIASAGTTGGFSEEQLKTGAGRLNSKQTQALGNYLQETKEVSQASGLQGLSLKYGGLVSYANGGPGDPPKSEQKLPTLYVDRNDPAGQARYQAYQDSLLLHKDTANRIQELMDAKTAEEWRSRNPDAFDPSSKAYKEHVAARERLGNPEPKATFYKDFGPSTFTSPISSRYITREYYEPVQPVKYGVNYMTPLAPKETSLPQTNLAIPNLPRVSRFDKQPYYTVDKKGNKILSGMDIWDERTKSWKRREVTPEEIQYYSPKTKDLGRVEFVGGGELPPANTSPNLTALAQANPENNYFNNINLGPAGPSSNADVEDAIQFYYDDNGRTQFAVRTDRDKSGNSLYTTTNLAGLEKTVNSIEDENLRMAALGNMPGPLSYNKGYANLDLSPAARRSLGKESYFGDFGTEGNRQDIGSFEALMGRMNPLDVDPKTLKMRPINTVALRGPSKPNPVPEGRGIESCGPNGCIWQNQAGGPISYANGGGLGDPPKEQNYFANLYNTGKQYLSPFISEIGKEVQAFAADNWPSIKSFGIKSAKDLTGAAFDAIVNPPKIDEKTGKKAEPSFYDNWIYAPIRNMSTSVLPSNIVALKQSMEGIETPLENSFFPNSELKDIYKLVEKAEADGRNYVTYTDYNPTGNVTEQKSVSGYLGNQERVRTTLGQFTFKKDPKTGIITIEDTYDFNPTTLDAHNVSKFTKEELSKKKPSELLDLGYNYYVNQGKNSATAMYLATRYWVAPYHAKGNPPVKLTLNPEDYKDVEADSSNQTTTPNVETNQFKESGRPISYAPGGLTDRPRRRKKDQKAPITVSQPGPEWVRTGPGLMIDGKLYQSTELTGNTLIPTDPVTGEQIPILLPEATVYPQEDPITKALRRTGTGLLGSTIDKNEYNDVGDRIRDARNDFTLNALSATGDIMGKPQQYLINAPLALAMGQKPNLSMFPTADKLRGINNGPAYPSETFGITNPYGAFAVDFLTDPSIAFNVGVGLARGLPATGKYLASKFFPKQTPSIPSTFVNPPASSQVSKGVNDAVNRSQNTRTVSKLLDEGKASFLTEQEFKQLQSKSSRAPQKVDIELGGYSQAEQEKAFREGVEFATKWSYDPVKLDLIQREKDRLLKLALSYPHGSPERLQAFNKYNSLSVADAFDPRFKRKVSDMFKMAQTTEPKDPGFTKNKDYLVSVDPNDPIFKSLPPADQKYVLDNYKTIRGARTPHSTITLRKKPYNTEFLRVETKKPFDIKDPKTWLGRALGEPELYEINYSMLQDPDIIRGVAPHEFGHDLQGYKNWVNLISGYDPNYGYYTGHGRNLLAKRVKDALVEPVKPKGTNKYEYETWLSAYSELHSEIMKAREKFASTYVKRKDFSSLDEAIDYIKSRSDDDDFLDLLIEHGDLEKHFKPTTTKEEKRFLVKIAPAIVPTVLGAGTAAAVAGSEPKEIIPPDFRYGGPVKYQNGGLPGEMLYRSTSPGAPLAYDSPTANGYLLPDPNRPELMNTGATEYKMEVDGVLIPRVVNGMYFNPEDAYQRYRLTGEKFKPTADPSAYSKFYDEINKLGLMQQKRSGGPTKFQTGGPIDSANPEQTPTQPEKIVYIGAGITRAGNMEDPKGILDRENARAYYKALGYKDENIRFLEGAGQTKELENSILKAVRENPQGNIIIDAFSGAIGSAKRAWPKLTEEERKRVSEIIMAGGAYDGRWLASEDNFPGTKFTNRPDIKGHYAHYEQYLKKLQESQPKVEEPKLQLWSPPSPQVTNPANIYQGYTAEPVSTYVVPPVPPSNRVQLNPPDFRYGGGLRRWFKEEWTDVKTGEPCGRESASDSSRPYPYCRPANKVSSKTPATTKHPEAKSRAKSKTGPTRVKPITR